VDQVAASNLPPTRIEYFEQLADECLRDYASMQRGFIAWAEEHVPRWQALGMREGQRRLRIDVARNSFVLCQQLEAEGATPGQIRKRLRMRYEDARSEGLDLYNLMLQRTDQTEPPHYGTTEDIVQRQALRIMIANAEVAVTQAYCAWTESPDTPNTHATQSIYDLSGVEELELHLGMLRFQQQCFAQRPRLPSEAVETEFYTWGQAARQEFFRKHGFMPEEATTPFIPVTVEGPVDHDVYYAALRAEEEQDERR
jgi:hypothetical protein